MEREMLNFAIKDMQCVPGGIKEATIMAGEFLKNSETPKNDSNSLSSPNRVVTALEFAKAVSVLIEHGRLSWDKDYVPETWHCDIDCSEIGISIICPGEHQIDSDSKKLCRHFKDSGNI